MRICYLIYSLVFYCTLSFDQSGYPYLTFGDQGQVVDHLGGTLDFVKTIELQDDQKILAGGLPIQVHQEIWPWFGIYRTHDELLTFCDKIYLRGNLAANFKIVIFS